MKTWTNINHQAPRTHLLVGEETTLCGRLVPHGALVVTVDVPKHGPIPCDCKTCEQAWLSRPRKVTR